MKSYNNKIVRLAMVSTSLILISELLFADDNISRLDERLTQLEQVLDRNGLLGLSSELDKLKEEQRALRGKIEEIEFALDSKRIKNQTEVPLPKERLSANTVPDLIKNNPEISVEKDIKNNLEPKINTELTGEEIYKNSFALLKAADYENAIIGFRKYLSEYRDGKFADNSMFWIGEAYWVTQEFEKAIEEYVQLTNTYPQSQKSSHALLKIGYCYEKLGKTAEATEALKDLQKKFPNSTAARLGAVKLEKLQNNTN